MYAKKSLISLHTFFVPRRVVVWFVLGWRVVVWFVLGRRVVVWFVLGQIPTRFYDFFRLDDYILRRYNCNGINIDCIFYIEQQEGRIETKSFSCCISIYDTDFRRVLVPGSDLRDLHERIGIQLLVSHDHEPDHLWREPGICCSLLALTTLRKWLDPKEVAV